MQGGRMVRAFKGAGEMWRSHFCDRKEALLIVSLGGGMVWAAVCHFSMRNALALSHWITEHCSRVRALSADVMSQTDTLVFVFFSVMLCGFSSSLFILRLPLHMAVSVSLSSDPPPLLLLGLFLWMSTVSDGGQEGPAEFGEHLQAAWQCKSKGGVRHSWCFTSTFSVVIVQLEIL